MAGDAELARALAALAERYRPDLEAALTPTLGANTAALVVGAVREAASVAQRAASSLAVDAAEFVREESRDTPAREEVDDFHRDVDTLRDRVERLAARADALRRALERKP
jgi:ubiquinone biosynthesis protein UbiJ